MAWQFILTDLQGVAHGELTGADNRSVSDLWMRVGTASCTIPLWHTLSNTVMDPAQDTLLRCYRTDDSTGTKTLAFHGPVVSAEETGDAGSQHIAISAASPLIRLQKRILESTKAGIEWTNIDLSQIGKNIVDTANGRGDTGISTNVAHGATFVSSGTLASTGRWWLKPAAEALNEIANGVTSFEWRLRPIDPVTGGTWPRIALMDFAPKSTFNVTKADAIFEYGTSRANVTGYSRKVDRSTMINKAMIPVSGWPDTPAQWNGVTQDLITSSDSAAITARGLWEEVIQDGGVIASDLRTMIADYHRNVRKVPRQIITFSPASDARPAPYVDYKVGETVRARAVVRGVTRFDALFRVYGVSFSIDTNGSESIEVELIDPAAGS